MVAHRVTVDNAPKDPHGNTKIKFITETNIRNSEILQLPNQIVSGVLLIQGSVSVIIGMAVKYKTTINTA